MPAHLLSLGIAPLFAVANRSENRSYLRDKTIYIYDRYEYESTDRDMVGRSGFQSVGISLVSCKFLIVHNDAVVHAR